MSGRGAEKPGCRLVYMRRLIAGVLLSILVFPGAEAAEPGRARMAMVVSREANATVAGVAVL